MSRLEDRANALIAEHNEMGHDGIGCGCLDALDALYDEDQEVAPLIYRLWEAFVHVAGVISRIRPTAEW